MCLEVLGFHLLNLFLSFFLVFVFSNFKLLGLIIESFRCQTFQCSRIAKSLKNLGLISKLWLQNHFQIIYNAQIKMKEKNKKVGSYIIKMDECLGRGGFASTYKAYKDKNYNQPYAVKIIQKQDIQKLLENEVGYFIKRVQEQYKALQNLKHPNIVLFFDVEQTTNNLYLFFQYCQQDLEKYIRDHLFDRKEEDILNFTKQIISACSYFTSKGFLHRDIKPANILIKNKQIKIADFGLATQMVDIEKSVTFAGTPHYMAPQILRGSSVKMKAIGKCDVWSVGVTLYELATGELPFGLTKKDLSEQKIIERIQGKFFEIKVNGFPFLQKILKLMLVADPQQRISFIEIQKNMLTELQLNK